MPPSLPPSERPARTGYARITFDLPWPLSQEAGRALLHLKQHCGLEEVFAVVDGQQIALVPQLAPSS